VSGPPFPVPEGAHLGGRTHGERVTCRGALECAALPDFPELWAIVPEGEGLRLMWADACTLAQLERADAWNREALAEARAHFTPRGKRSPPPKKTPAPLPSPEAGPRPLPGQLSAHNSRRIARASPASRPQKGQNSMSSPSSSSPDG
jgi:hypothetical protein